MTIKFEVPLDHNDPEPRDLKRTIEVSADLVYASSKDLTPTRDASSCEVEFQRWFPEEPKQPILVYLCGGPGDGNKPARIPFLNEYALNHGFGILYPNYRGCAGSGSEITADSPKKHLTADYLAHFRQDSIVADLEAIRMCLNGIKFILLGQSFGGWIATTYLSFCPKGLRGVYITAGLPPVGQDPKSVYEHLYHRLVNKNGEYYQKYPEDGKKVMEIVKFLARLDGGKGLKLCGTGSQDEQPERLSARGFLTLGRRLGGDNGPQEVHDLVNKFFKDREDTGTISRATIESFIEAGGTTFKLPVRPLYGVLHEAIYISGPGIASKWAAQRVVQRKITKDDRRFEWLQDDCDWKFESVRPGKVMPPYFSGEMIFEFMLVDAGEKLAPFIRAAKTLAEKDDWPPLYDEKALGRNGVPVRAMIFRNDMYVDPELSHKTACMIGNCHVVEPGKGMTHGSIKYNTEEVLKRLLGKKFGRHAWEWT
ncbi:hypothetical protein VTI74DRAFT_4102 [Chaetomium olivicolor]